MVRPLQIGALSVDSPVVLAPMAAVTSAPFRELCRSFGGGGLFVSEMVSARAIVEGNAKSALRASFGPSERPRSLQLYAVNPTVCAEAIRRVIAEHGVNHVDLNLGCPAPKVTRAGGGAALPLRTAVVRDLLESAVRAANDAGALDGRSVPVTIKFRRGLDPDTPTAPTLARIALDSGIAAIALHARWADQLYSGSAEWRAVAELVAAVGGQGMAVLGNGDIWAAHDAVDMMRTTGCDGVVVGRGCLGRPWFFRDVDAALAGDPVPSPPVLGDVAAVMRRHAAALCDWHGEPAGIRDFRKHPGWYLTGYPVGGAIRRRLAAVSSLAELDDLLATLDPATTVPPTAADLARGHTNGPRRVALPDRYRRALDARSSGGDERLLRELAADPLPPDERLASGGAESYARAEAFAGG
jgi:nifR3 family TIM-barrel protein